MHCIISSYDSTKSLLGNIAANRWRNLPEKQNGEQFRSRKSLQHCVEQVLSISPCILASYWTFWYHLVASIDDHIDVCLDRGVVFCNNAQKCVFPWVAPKHQLPVRCFFRLSYKMALRIQYLLWFLKQTFKVKIYNKNFFTPLLFMSSCAFVYRGRGLGRCTKNFKGFLQNADVKTFLTKLLLNSFKKEEKTF